MTTETNSKTRPIYRVYAVSKDTEEKSSWLEIGAAWKHKDGKGLTLQLTALPIGDAQMVLREPKASKSAAA